MKRVIANKSKPLGANPLFGNPINEQNTDFQEEVDSFKGKKEVVLLKKFAKFQEDIDRGIKYILTDQVPSAIAHLVQVIQKGTFLDQSEFKGFGTQQQWKDRCPGGPLAWFQRQTKLKRMSRNPFDLLSICFTIELTRTTIQLPEVLEYYQTIATCLNEPQTPEVDVGIGNAYYLKHQYLKAEQYYLKAIETKPAQILYENLAWLEGVVFSRKEKGNHYASKCTSMNHYNVASSFIAITTQKDKSKAANQASYLFEQNPDFSRIQAFIGTILEDQQEQKQHYEKMFKKDPFSLSPSINLALLTECKEYQESRQILQNLLEFHQNHYEIFWAMGQLQFRQDNYEGSIKYYKKALEFNPYHFFSMKPLGLSYSAQLNFDSALSWYQKYIDLNPYDEQVFNQLGLTHSQLGHKQEAIRCIEKALEVEPSYRQGLKNLTNLYRQMNRHEDAIATYKRFIKVEPGNVDLNKQLAFYYLQLNQYVEAHQQGLNCANLSRSCRNILKKMANVCLEKQDYPHSLLFLLRHSNLNSQFDTQLFMDIFKKMVRIQFIHDLSQIEKGTEVRAKNIWIFLQMGKVYIELGEHDEAARLYSVVRRLSLPGTTQRVLQELKMMFGDLSEGVCGLLDKIKWQAEREDYYNLFYGMYAKQER